MIRHRPSDAICAPRRATGSLDVSNTESASATLRTTPSTSVAPDRSQNQAPPGQRVSLYARDLPGARMLAVSPGGHVLVSLSRAGQVVMLRQFAGLEHGTIAELLGVSRGTIDRDWRFALAWLHREIEGGGGRP